MHVSQKELAGLFDVSTRTIQRWGEDGLNEARVGAEATYDLKLAIAWRVDSVQADVDDEYRIARTRVVTAKAEEAERANAIQRGELIPMDDIEGLLRESLMSVDATLRSSPNRFASALAERSGLTLKQARVILDDMIELARGAIRNMGSEG